MQILGGIEQLAFLRSVKPPKKPPIFPGLGWQGPTSSAQAPTRQPSLQAFRKFTTAPSMEALLQMASKAPTWRGHVVQRVFAGSAPPWFLLRGAGGL